MTEVLLIQISLQQLEIWQQLKSSSASYFDLTVISTVLYSGRHKLLMYCIPTTDQVRVQSIQHGSRS